MTMKIIAERLATSGVFLVNGIGTGAWAVEVPRVKDSLRLTNTALGLSLFFFAFGAVIAMPLAGRLGYRIGSGTATALLGPPLIGFASGLVGLRSSLFSLAVAALVIAILGRKVISNPATVRLGEC